MAMAIEKTAQDVKRKFHVEQKYVQRYIAFLEAKTAVHDSEAQEISTILRQYQLPGLPSRKDWSRRYE